MKELRNGGRKNEGRKEGRKNEGRKERETEGKSNLEPSAGETDERRRRIGL